jgi:hypothetical protein
MSQLRRCFDGTGDGCGRVMWTRDGQTWVNVVASRVMVLGDGWGRSRYAGTLWGRLPDDDIRGVNELFTWDEDG